MREILYKGFHKDENGTEKIFVDGKWVKGEWVYGYYIRYGWTHQEKDYIVPLYASALYAKEVIPSTVGQYTGLTDKNGKKIFEGDIVLDHYWNIRGVVTFCRGTFTSGLRAYNGWVLKRCDGTVEDCELVIYDDNDFEIIGNIYDNPELLRSDTE